MATYMKTLHDAEGNTIAPITLEEAVHDENAVSLKAKLAGKQDTLTIGEGLSMDEDGELSVDTTVIPTIESMKYVHEEVTGTLVRHWANESESAEDKTSTFGIQQVETGIVYSEAVDVVPCRYAYEATDEPIVQEDVYGV